MKLYKMQFILTKETIGTKVIEAEDWAEAKKIAYKMQLDYRPEGQSTIEWSNKPYEALAFLEGRPLTAEEHPPDYPDEETRAL
jgi:hypothetical protein